MAQNLPLWSLCPSLTVGMTKIPKIPGLFYYFVVAGISGIFPKNPRPKWLRLLLNVRARMDLPEKKFHLESGLNQRDRATGGFCRNCTHRKPRKNVSCRCFHQTPTRLPTNNDKTTVFFFQKANPGSYGKWLWVVVDGCACFVSGRCVSNGSRRLTRGAPPLAREPFLPSPSTALAAASEA